MQVAVHNCTEPWLGPGTCDLRCDLAVQKWPVVALRACGCSFNGSKFFHNLLNLIFRTLPQQNALTCLWCFHQELPISKSSIFDTYYQAGQILKT